MPTKTDRILDLLPGTFAPRPAPTALLAVLDAFGSELLRAENDLARVLQAHWVDYADRGALSPHDLNLLGALYGLSARDDEEVEEFREHLKRHVRTFLDGTATVRGMLRVAADTIGLRIDDAHLDTWWRRPGDDLVTSVDDGRDAAGLVFGPPAVATGQAAAAAVLGSVDLSGGVDVSAAALLRIALDGAPPVTVDLAATGHPGHVTGDDVVAAVRAAVPEVAATLVDGRLRLSAPGSLEIVEDDGDAAAALLGLPSRRFTGADARPARLRGVPVPGGFDVTEDGPRYLRVVLEIGSREIDLGVGHHTADDVAAAIVAAFGAPVAIADSDALVLTSPTVGPSGRVEIAAPAAQDVGGRLFGTRLAVGAAALAARLAGTVDVTGVLDLSGWPDLALRIDGTAISVALDGISSRIELAAAIDAAAGTPVTELGGSGIAVVSPTMGTGGEVVLLESATGGRPDPGQALFGVTSRRRAGRPAVRAQLTGAVPLVSTDLAARHLLAIGVDGAEPVEIDLRTTAAGPVGASAARAVPPSAIVAAIEARLPGVASLDGDRLTLASPTPGAPGRIEVRAIRRTLARPFVTRATVIDEAAWTVLGFVDRAATGTAPSPARVAGTVDLSRGSDLSLGGWLRLAVDGGPFQEISCAGPRPRSTLDTDVLAALEAQAPGLASIRSGRLTLASRTTGPASRMEFDLPRPALHLLGLDAPDAVDAQGSDPTSVRISGTADLSAGVELPAGAALAVGVDGGPVAEIALAPDGPAHLTLNQVVIAVNGALVSSVASRDTAHLLLRSPTAGTGSRLDLAVPSAPGSSDATAALLGFPAPRGYHGGPATPARLVAPADLGGPLDVRRARRLLLTVDTRPATGVDLAATADDASHATLPDLVNAVNAAAPGIASAENGHLVLTSPTTGTASRISLAPDPADDGRASVLGSVPDTVTGAAADPPTLVGDVAVEGTVDLTRRPRLRVEIDGEPLEMDVAGAGATTTSLDEVVAAVNAARPGTAARTDDSRLRLTGPAGSTRLAVVPLRHLELTEYLRADAPTTVGPVTVRHAGSWSALSDSVRPEPVLLRLVPVHGAAGPAVLGPAGLIRIETLVPPGAELCIDATGATISATITWAGHAPVAVAPGDIHIEPSPGYQARDVLQLPVGRSTWRYLESQISRFDTSSFQPPVRATPAPGEPSPLPPATFAGRPFAERVVFDVSRFSTPGRPTVFDSRTPVPDLPVDVTTNWYAHRAGTLGVNVPLDLDARFGARFNDAYFAHPSGDAESFPAAVCEPDTDERYVVRLMTIGYPGAATAPAVAASRLVDARLVDVVPLGYVPQPMPFRTPVRLHGGGAPSSISDGRARLFLSEEGFDGRFLEVAAKQPGPAGNSLEVSSRPAGPGRFDVTAALRGARFESAVVAVLGRPPEASPAALLSPGPVGILRARAGGVACRADRRDTGRTTGPSPSTATTSTP